MAIMVHIFQHENRHIWHTWQHTTSYHGQTGTVYRLSRNEDCHATASHHAQDGRRTACGCEPHAVLLYDVVPHSGRR